MIEATVKRKILFLIIFVGLVCIVIACIRFLSVRTPKQGELRVDSQPTVSIFLDEKNIGKSPYRDKIDAGEHTVKLIPESATSQVAGWEGKIIIGGNLLTYINANLTNSELASAVDVVWLEKITSKSSELSVTTSPDGATVFVDDVSKGVTPISISDITTGDHSLSVVNTGFLSRTIKIKTTPGYRLIANLKLALSAGGAPEASPTAVPTEASISGTPTLTPKSTPTKAATSSASNIPDPPKPYVIIKDTPTGFLRVRTEPSTSASEAARVKPGEKYSYSDAKNGWYHIKYDGKNDGWVSGQYVDKFE